MSRLVPRTQKHLSTGIWPGPPCPCLCLACGTSPSFDEEWGTEVFILTHGAQPHSTVSGNCFLCRRGWDFKNSQPRATLGYSEFAEALVSHIGAALEAFGPGTLPGGWWSGPDSW